MSDLADKDSQQEILSNENTASNLYKDFSGIDTESFILTTLKTNPKDRNLLLLIEKTLRDFIQNHEQTTHQFQAMNSYERMIVHRVAAYFGLDHNVDKNGQAIIVTKTSNTRIPNLSFESISPTDDVTERRQPIRNNKIFYSNKSSDNREKFSNKTNRKQQRFNGNQQTNMQSTSQFINSRNQTIYYPQQSVDHDYKQPTVNPSMYNYIPMISPNTAYQHANNLCVPILVQQQPTGQIQYVFPTQQPMSSNGQYMPVYRPDGMPHVPDNNLYYSSPYVQVYPTHPYPPTQQPVSSTSIHYATNQLAALSLQSPSTNSIKSFQTNRQFRPLNSNSTDKQSTSNDNEIKSSDQNTRQEKDS